MTEPIKHDWPKIIAEIEYRGITIYKIGLIVGRPYQIVASWKRGVEPKHSFGEKLLALYDECVPHGTSKI